jgi:hypothetical protein
MNTEQKLKLIKAYQELAQASNWFSHEFTIENLDKALVLIMEIKYELANMVRQSIA